MGKDKMPTPVGREQRISFGIMWFATEEEADTAHRIVRKQGLTYNGGWFHGRPCGREATWDREVDGVKQYAVTN